jgi:hypothetical protein
MHRLERVFAIRKGIQDFLQPTAGIPLRGSSPVFPLR